jgi:hypothetical protein
MLKYLAICFFLALQILDAQTRNLSTTIALTDWGISSAKSIRLGTLSVIHDKGGDRLAVNLLRTSYHREKTAVPPIVYSPPIGTMRNTPLSRATWIWNTDTLLQNPKEENKTLSTVTDGRFDEIFLQVPRDFTDDTLHDAQLRHFIEQLRAHGGSVYALTGDPHFSLRQNHPIVQKFVQRVIDFNKSSPERARFVGIHLDIEPYLLPGFGGPRRDSILIQYLTITRIAAQRIHDGGLLFGTDIPFWYDLPDEFTGIVDSIDFGGIRKPVNEHVTDMADELCIMSYRTKAHGSNGLIVLSEPEIAYALKRGKSVFVGFETDLLPDEENVSFRGVPTTVLAEVGKTEQIVCVRQAGDSAVVSLMPRSATDSLSTEGRTDSTLNAIPYFWEVANSTPVPSTNLSFAKLGKKRLEETVRSVIGALKGYRSFAGVAIHHAASYAALPE